MKSIFMLEVCIISAFAIFFIGCSFANTASLENALEIKLSPTPPQNLLQGANDKVLQENWQMPLPKKRKIVRRSKDTMNSEDGKRVETTTITYAPLTTFFFMRESDNYTQENKPISRILKLEYTEELKVKEKIFGYVVFARNTKTDEKTGKPLPFGHMFVYAILDKDGDGKFETHLTDDLKILVPQWASR